MGFVTNAVISGVSLIEVEMALSSVCTLFKTCGDLARAAEKTALEYLRAMVEAARRPMAADASDEEAATRNMADNEREEGGDGGDDEDGGGQPATAQPVALDALGRSRAAT